MGRYAFFSTGLEYKFAFGVQSSHDITLFGGRLVWDMRHMEWSSEEKEYTLACIRHLETILGIEPTPFPEFKQTLNGTEALWNAIEKKVKSKSELYYRVLLGCLIYHQLLYTAELSCKFEL